MNQHPKEEASLIADALIFSGQFSCGRQKPAFLTWLIEVHWAQQTSDNRHRNHFVLTPSGKNKLTLFMKQHYGNDWHIPARTTDDKREAFLQSHLKHTLPKYVHHRVVQSVWSGDSKSKKQCTPSSITPVTCDTLRLRTQNSVQLSFSEWTLNSQEDMARYGEIILNQHAIDRFQRLSANNPIHIMTIENPGAWHTLPLLPNLIAVYVPGNNQQAACNWIQKLDHYSWSHFGDLDEKGISIASNIAKRLGKPLSLFIPEWWNEYIELFGIETTSENGWGRKPILKPINNNTLIGTLAENKQRMEQEAILLDKRFESTLSEHLSIHLEQTAKSR